MLGFFFRYAFIFMCFNIPDIYVLKWLANFDMVSLLLRFHIGNAHVSYQRTHFFGIHLTDYRDQVNVIVASNNIV